MINIFTFELGLYNHDFGRENKLRPEHVKLFIGETAGKAKYQFFKYIGDCYNWTFKDFLRWCYCKKVGVADVRHLFEDREMFEHVKQLRGLDFIYQGMKVLACGKSGTIVGAGSGARLHIVLDGEWRARTYHPYYYMVYFDRDGLIIKDYCKEA